MSEYNDEDELNELERNDYQRQRFELEQSRRQSIEDRRRLRRQRSSSLPSLDTTIDPFANLPLSAVRATKYRSVSLAADDSGPGSSRGMQMPERCFPSCPPDCDQCAQGTCPGLSSRDDTEEPETDQPLAPMDIASSKRRKLWKSQQKIANKIQKVNQDIEKLYASSRTLIRDHKYSNPAQQIIKLCQEMLENAEQLLQKAQQAIDEQKADNLRTLTDVNLIEMNNSIALDCIAAAEKLVKNVKNQLKLRSTRCSIS